MGKEAEKVVVGSETQDYTNLLVSLLEELQSPATNSKKRSDKKSTFNAFISSTPLAIPLIESELEKLSQYRYTEELLARVRNIDNIEKYFHNSEKAFPPEIIGFFLLNQKNSELVQKILTEYIRLPGKMIEKNKDKIEEKWPEIAMFAIDIGYSLLWSVNGLDDKTEKSRLVLQAIYDNATDSKETSLMAILSTSCRIDATQLARVSGALEEIILHLQTVVLGTEVEKSPGSRMTPALKDFIGDRNGINIYRKEWGVRSEALLAHIDEKRRYPLAWMFPPEQSEIVSLANILFLDLQIDAMKNLQEYNMSKVIMPDNGMLFGLYPSDENIAELKKQWGSLFQTYFKLSENTQTHTVEDLEYRRFFLEIMVPEIETQALQNDIQKSREKAAGGLSTISERGDKIIASQEGSEAEKYLYSLGIRECILRQTGRGIQVSLIWFTQQFDFFIDEKYDIQNVGDISEQTRLWLENFFLQSIGNIKNQLAQVEAPQPKVGIGGARPFRGRRPHLKALPHGHESSLNTFPVSSDEFDDEQTELDEKHRFILFHFGVSIATLNNLFRSIQDENYYLAHPEEFEELLNLYETEVPPEYRRITSAQAIREIIMTAIGRSFTRDRRVKFQKRGGLLVETARGSKQFAPTNDRFEITFVSEAKAGEGIEVDPMNFYGDEISTHMMKLLDTNLPESNPQEIQ